MVRNRRALYGAVAGLALVLAAYTWSRDDRAAAVSLSLSGLQRAPRTASADTPLPRIGLDRLQKPHGGMELGKRDIFDFGPPPPTPPPPPAPPTPVPTPVVDAALQELRAHQEATEEALAKVTLELDAAALLVS